MPGDRPRQGTHLASPGSSGAEQDGRVGHTPGPGRGPARRTETRDQAVSTRSACSRPSSSMADSRMRNFWIFPVTVIGNESVSFQ